ncbi:MAG: hypothetical protein WCD89_21935 [Anaerocolumna sp.]
MEITKLKKEGIDKNALKAGLNFCEFKFKEADFDSYPKGLIYGLKIMDNWLYEENNPFIHMNISETFEFLREKIDMKYYEDILDKYFIRNQHKSVVVLEPSRNLLSKMTNEISVNINNYKNSLKINDNTILVEDNKQLERYQNSVPSIEDLNSIPRVKKSDIISKAEAFINEEHRIDNTTFLFHEMITNGIRYIKIIFKINNIPNELLPYVGVLKSVLGYTAVDSFNYYDLFNEININTGGIKVDTNIYTDIKDVLKYKFTFEIKTKVLYKNVDKAIELIEAIIFTSNLKEKRRLYEIVTEARTKMQVNMVSNYHTVAAVRAMSYFSEQIAINDITNGISYYRFLEQLECEYGTKAEEIIENLLELTHYIFREENLIVDYTGSLESSKILEIKIRGFKKKLYSNMIAGISLNIKCKKLNEAFQISSPINYVCKAGRFNVDKFNYTGQLRVLRNIITYECLWENIRVKGGAYGCTCNLGKTGDCCIVSYRDPNIHESINVFQNVYKYISNFNANENTINKFIVGAIRELDMPLTPYALGSRSLNAYMSNITVEAVQKERDDILNVTQKSIRDMSQYVKEFTEHNYICVIGNSDKIKSNSEIYER